MIRSEPFHRALGAAQPVSVAELLALHGRGSQAVLLLVVSLLCVLPVSGAGMVLSLLLFALAWRWPRPRGTVVPGRLAALQLDVVWSRRCLRALAWLHGGAGRLLRRRWRLLRHPAAFAWWRLWIAAMALVIFLPLPFGNVLPGLSLVLLGLGWMYRDGLLLLLSLPAGLGVIAFGWFSAGLIVDTAAAAGQQVMGWF